MAESLGQNTSGIGPAGGGPSITHHGLTHHILRLRSGTVRNGQERSGTRSDTAYPCYKGKMTVTTASAVHHAGSSQSFLSHLFGTEIHRGLPWSTDGFRC
jgi:hypothetical protein